MTLYTDKSPALFVSQHKAHSMCHEVSKLPVVTGANAFKLKRCGEILGYRVTVHYTDGTSRPLSEDLVAKLDK